MEQLRPKTKGNLEKLAKLYSESDTVSRCKELEELLRQGRAPPALQAQEAQEGDQLGRTWYSCWEWEYCKPLTSLTDYR